jgi:hypothetical protein
MEREKRTKNRVWMTEYYRIENRVWKTRYYRIENRVRWKENRGLRTGFGSQNTIGLRTG